MSYICGNNKIAIIMRRLFNPKSIISLFVIGVFMLAACNMKRKSSGDSAESADTLEKARVEQDVREFVYPLPTSFEVTEMLNRIGRSEERRVGKECRSRWSP